jgi:hypothetical protein
VFGLEKKKSKKLKNGVVLGLNTGEFWKSKNRVITGSTVPVRGFHS